MASSCAHLSQSQAEVIVPHRFLRLFPDYRGSIEAAAPFIETESRFPAEIYGSIEGWQVLMIGSSRNAGR